MIKSYMQNSLLAGVAILFGSTNILAKSNSNGPVLTAAVSLVSGKTTAPASARPERTSVVSASVDAALEALQTVVQPLSDPRALKDAFQVYFAFKAAHPEQVKKPYLYFVDYGQPSTSARGYVFDMTKLDVVDGPFTVAHGRGSSASQYGVPTRFSNAAGSNATSLGLYVAQETYNFHGKTGGRSYSSVGLRLAGVSTGYNDSARSRGVVAHGAPYVTPARAGRSEGCPAMEQGRARRILPELANGGMVFLFAPQSDWMAQDPWLKTSADSLSGMASAE
jgi:hypothetical protein